MNILMDSSESEETLQEIKRPFKPQDSYFTPLPVIANKLMSLPEQITKKEKDQIVMDVYMSLTPAADIHQARSVIALAHFQLCSELSTIIIPSPNESETKNLLILPSSLKERSKHESEIENITAHLAKPANF